MVKYILKRIVMAAVTVLLIACITFGLMNLVPGGPFLSEKAPSQAVLDSLNAKYGLDKPVIVQLKNYLIHAVQGDFGVSFKMQKNRPVTTIISELFPTSAKIGAIALVFAVAVGIPMGCIEAYFRGKAVDNTLTVFSTVGIAVPTFVVATMLLILFGVVWKVLPTVGLHSWKSYLMPCFSLALYPMCYIARLTRSSMLDAIGQDYIKTARAKGLPTRKIIFKHALRNSLIPVITYLGPLTAYILTGGFVVEKVFSIPGLGRYFIQSLLNRDYPLIMGTTIFLAIIIVAMNLVVDIMYKVVDPRISFAKGGD